MAKFQANPPQDEAKAFADSLSEEDLEYLKQVARKTCARVASASRMDSKGTVTWEPIGHKDGVDIYLGETNESSDRKAKSSSSQRKYLCGVTYVPATIDEVVQFFHSKTELQRAKNDGSKTSFNAFEREILNTKTLYKIRKRSSNAPRHCISLKWMRLGSTINDMEDRDFVFLECQDSIFDEKVKRRGWVCSMHSVQLPGCPPLDGYVRGSLYRSGYVFRETETPNVLQVVCIMDMDFKGTMNMTVSNLVLKSRVMIVGAIREHFKAIDDQLNQPAQEEDAVPCPLCQDFLASTHCMTCDQIVCLNCSQQIDEESSVCTICVMHGKVDEMMANQDNETDDEDASIMLPAIPVPPKKKDPLPQVSEVARHSDTTSDEGDNQLEDAPVAPIDIKPSGFFANAWAASIPASEAPASACATSFVEPDGRDDLYTLAVQRLHVSSSAEQEATRLALVNLYYEHVVAPVS